MFKGITGKDWIIGLFTGGWWIIYKIFKNGSAGKAMKVIAIGAIVFVTIGIIATVTESDEDKFKRYLNNTDMVQMENIVETNPSLVIDGEKAIDIIESLKKAEAERIAKEKAEAERIAKEKAKKEAEQLALAKSKGYDSYEAYEKGEAEKIAKEKEIAKSFGFDDYIEYIKATDAFTKKGNLDLVKDKLYLNNYLSAIFIKNIDIQYVPYIYAGTSAKKNIDFNQYKNGKAVIVTNYTKDKVKDIRITWKANPKKKITENDLFEFSNSIYTLYDSSLTQDDKKKLVKKDYKGWKWSVYELEKRIGDYLIKTGNTGEGYKYELTIAYSPLLIQDKYESKIKEFDRAYHKQNAMNQEGFTSKHRSILAYNYGKFFTNWSGEIYYEYKKTDMPGYYTSHEELRLLVYSDNGVRYVAAMDNKDKAKMIKIIKEQNIANNKRVKFSGYLYIYRDDTLAFSNTIPNVDKPTLNVVITDIRQD